MSVDRIYVDISRMKFLKAALDDMAEWKYPYTVMRSLNDMAFEMVGRKSSPGTIAKTARSKFDHSRSKSFVQNLAWAEKAKGKDVDKMVSGAGIVVKKGNVRSAPGLARQETASPVEHGYTPLNTARVNKNESRQVSASARLKKLNYVDLTMFRRGKLMRGMILAHRQKKPVRYQTKTGKKLIGRPIGNKRLTRGRENGKRFTKVPINWLYVRNPQGIARLKTKVPFVQIAGNKAFGNFNEYFYKNFDRYFK